MIPGVDRAFGRILDKLRERGFDRDTIAVFTSDHGDMLRSHGRQWTKSFPEAESCRVPLLVRWPGHVPAGRASELLIGALDLMPTLLGLMGARVPPGCHGRDLSNAVRSGDGQAVESVPPVLFRSVLARRLHAPPYVLVWRTGSAVLLGHAVRRPRRFLGDEEPLRRAGERAVAEVDGGPRPVVDAPLRRRRRDHGRVAQGLLPHHEHRPGIAIQQGRPHSRPPRRLAAADREVAPARSRRPTSGRRLGRGGGIDGAISHLPDLSMANS
jgi:hypothetical protein